MSKIEDKREQVKAFVSYRDNNGEDKKVSFIAYSGCKELVREEISNKAEDILPDDFRYITSIYLQSMR